MHLDFKKRIKHYFKSSYKDGHGIHSPFLFDFVTNTLFNRKNTILKIDQSSKRERKTGNSIIQIIKHLKPKKITEIRNTEDILSQYFSSVSNLDNNKTEELNRNIIGWNEVKQSLNLKTDILFINIQTNLLTDLQDPDLFLSLLNRNGIIIISNIYLNEDTEFFWSKFTSNQLVSQTINIYDIGVIFTDKTLQKENFKIRY